MLRWLAPVLVGFVGCSSFGATEEPLASDGGDAGASDDGASPRPDAQAPECLSASPFTESFEDAGSPNAWRLPSNDDPRVALDVSAQQAVDGAASLRVAVQAGSAIAKEVLSRSVGGSCAEVSFAIYLSEPVAGVIPFFVLRGKGTSGGDVELLGLLEGSKLELGEQRADGTGYAPLTQVSLESGEWSRVRVRYEGTPALTLSLNGSDAATSKPSRPFTGVSEMSLGAWYTPPPSSGTFHIDDLRVR